MNEWKTVRLGDVCEQINGVSYKPADVRDSLTNESCTLLRANNIFEDKLNYDELVFVDKKRVSNNQYMKKGDIIICASSGSKHLVGKAACLLEDKELTFGAFCKVIRADSIQYDYLKHYFFSPTYRSVISHLSEGANINNIKAENLENLQIPLPPIETQKQIASTLDKCTSVIEKHKKMLQKYDTLIKSRFIEMFGDNPVESGKWEVETLADVCSSVVRGPFGSALKKDVFVPKSNNTVKVYEQKHAIQKSANIGTYYISQEKYEELKRFECKPGDFIMSCSGTMGEFYQLPIGCEKGIINQALCKFSLNNKIEALFFLEWMKQSIHNLETKGSGIQNVAAVSFIKQIPVFLPPLTLQKQFSSFVQQIDKSKFAVQKSLEKTETLYKSLMQQYFG